MTETEWEMLAKPIKRIIERFAIDSREEEEMDTWTWEYDNDGNGSYSKWWNLLVEGEIVGRITHSEELADTICESMNAALILFNVFAQTDDLKDRTK